MKTIVILGSGGFIGNNLSHKLKSNPNNYVIEDDNVEFNCENSNPWDLAILGNTGYVKV